MAEEMVSTARRAGAINAVLTKGVSHSAQAQRFISHLGEAWALQ